MGTMTEVRKELISGWMQDKPVRGEAGEEDGEGR